MYRKCFDFSPDCKTVSPPLSNDYEKNSMHGRDEGRVRIFGPAPIRKTLEIKSSRLTCDEGGYS